MPSMKRSRSRSLRWAASRNACRSARCAAAWSPAPGVGEAAQPRPARPRRASPARHRHGRVQPGERLDRAAGGDRQADLRRAGAGRAARAASPPSASSARRRRLVGAPGRRARPAARPRTRTPRGCSAAAGRAPPGAQEAVQVGADVAQHPQAAVGVAGWSSETALRSRMPGRGERLLGDAGGGAELPGPLDGAERVAVEAGVRVGHREVVPAPGGLAVGSAVRRARWRAACTRWVTQRSSAPWCWAASAASACR